MSRARVAWVFGACAAACVGAFACSSSSSSGGGADAGPGDASGDAGIADTSSTGDSAHDGGGGDSACPTSLHPEPVGKTYCPSVAGDGGDSVCAVGEHCCMPSKMTGLSSTCSGAACGGTGMMAPKDWACSAPSSCATAGDKCCAVGQIIMGGTCGLPQIQMFKSTMCEAACAAGEIVVCQAQSDCTTGTCTLATAGGAAIGICM